MWFSSYRKRSKKFYSKYKTQAHNCKRHIFKPNIKHRTLFKCTEHLGLDLIISSINEKIDNLSPSFPEIGNLYPLLLWHWVLHNTQNIPKEHCSSTRLKNAHLPDVPPCLTAPTQPSTRELSKNQGQGTNQDENHKSETQTANTLTHRQRTRFVTECKAIIQIELLFLWNNTNTLKKKIQTKKGKPERWTVRPPGGHKKQELKQVQ